MSIFEDIQKKVFGGQSEKLNSVSDQSFDEQKLCGFVKDKVEESRSNASRIAHEGIWMTNIAYLLGFDSVFYDTNSKQFRNTALPSRYLKRGRLHVNKILPLIQNRLSRICKNRPKYDVRPNSTDTEDKEAARLGVQVIQMIWDKERVDHKRLNLMMWVQQCGFAFMKVSWDDTKGERIVDPVSGEFQGYQGDVRIDPVSAFEVFVDPLAKTMDEVQWLVHAKVRKLDYFKTHYPDRGDLVKEESAWLLSVQYEARINSMNTTGPTSSGVMPQMKNAAIELAYYEKPSKKHPNGRSVIVANGVLLKDDELPCGEIPFVKFDDIQIGGKFMSESIITHLRPIQDQYNRLITKRAEWTNRMLAGKVMAAKGHGIHMEAYNDQSGEFIEYDVVPGAPPPQPVQIPTIPQYAYAEEDKLDAMINQLSGINEVSQGQLPAAGIPAVGMQFLEEQDVTRLGVIIEQHEHAYSDLGRITLKYVAKYYEMPRVIKTAGRNLEYAVKSFVGRDLKNNFDVIVIKGSTIPGSKILRRQEILNAYERGLLGNPQDPKLREKVLSMLEFGDVAEMWQDYSVDMAQIKEDLDAIEKGEVPKVNELDNHELHIQEKNRYRKSDKFKVLSDVSKEILLNNIEEHIASMMKIANPGLEDQKNLADEMVAAAGAQNPGDAVEMSGMGDAGTEELQSSENLGQT